MNRLQREKIASDMEIIGRHADGANARMLKHLAEGNTEKASRAKASLNKHCSELGAYNRMLAILGYHAEWIYTEDGDRETVVIKKNE